MTKPILVALVLAVGCLPAPAAADEVVVRAEEASFAWTGKEAGVVGYEWSASLANPAPVEVDVEASLELLDGEGTVIARETLTVGLESGSRTEVGGPGSIPWADARRVDRFRVTLGAADAP